MTLTRWPANSNDEAREKVLDMLRSYRVARRNLEQQKALVQDAVASLHSPGTSDPSRARVQIQRSDDGMVQRIERIAAERRDLDRELERIEAEMNRLNELLRAIGELDTYERHVVVGQYIDGISSRVLGEMIDKSERTIALYRQSAVRKLARRMFMVVNNTSRSKEDGRC
jgi:DNA-directed RNA polymerase specialized sigma24 family protein